MTDDSDKPKVSCSFCGKSQDDVRTILASLLPQSPAWICDECIDGCVHMLVEKGYGSRWLLILAWNSWFRRLLQRTSRQPPAESN